MNFADTDDGRRFWSNGEQRQTAYPLMCAIAFVASDLDDAESIWSSGIIHGRDAQTSAEHLYLTATRNFPVSAKDLFWRGDATWATMVEARLLAGHPTARWPGR